MEKLNWHTEQRKINDLLPYEHNPRQMTEDEVRHLTASLEKFGLVEIPAIDTANRIVAGHQRLKIMQALGRGEETIDVRVPNRALTEEEFKEYLVRSNKNTGHWDFNVLGNVFSVQDLTEWGFSFSELGLAAEGGKSAIDTDNMAGALDSYMNSDIRQIVLYFKADDHAKAIQRLDKIVEATGKADYTEVFELLLHHYEDIGA